jgi:acyl-CoA synthetase (AMP-forming)/AMP-acid ligase II
LILGIIGAGARFTGVNPSYTAYEVTHHMQTTKPKLLIVEPSMLNTALAAAEAYGLPRSAVLVFDEHEANPYPDLRSWRVLLSQGESEFEQVCDPTTTIAAYFTTSGTSGLPKAAMISHSYLIAQAAVHCEKTSALPYPVRRLTHGPPFHGFSTPIVPSSIRSNYPIYVMRRFNETNFISCIARFQVTETYMPPAVLMSLPRSPLCTTENMQSLKQIWVGGAAASLKSRLPLYEKLSPDAQINMVWGLTEVGWVTAGIWPEKLLDDSVGRPLPGFSISTAATNSDAPTPDESGRLGELIVHAPFPMLGYLDNRAATAAAFDAASGGFKTGDIGCVDDAGKVVVVDRIKDLIKVRGWQVSPAEVELALHQHPDILDAAVISVLTATTRVAAALSAHASTAGTDALQQQLAKTGMAFSEAGTSPVSTGTDDTVAGMEATDAVEAVEAARAYVVARAGCGLTPRRVRGFVGELLARYKIPAEIVFVDAIPRNGAGKVKRGDVRAWEQTRFPAGEDEATP